MRPIDHEGRPALLHMPVSTVEDLACRGDLPSVKVGRRRRFIRQQVEAVLTGQE
jgi:excisionase family DNA binding protein